MARPSPSKPADGQIGTLASLRARVLLLVALALTPAFALIGWNQYRYLGDRRSDATASAMRIAHSRAIEFGDKISDMRSLLGILAGSPTALDDPSHPRCSQIVSLMRRESPLYANLGIVLPDGTLVCSAEPFERSRPPNYADRAWFQRTLASGDFVATDQVVGRLTSRHMLVGALPVRKESHARVEAVAFAGLDLASLSRFVADLPLPPLSTITVLDGSGRILAHHPAHETWVGRSYPMRTL